MLFTTPDHAADWVVETLRGPRVLSFLRAAIENRTAWMISVPIGRPIANTSTYVVDRSGRPAPAGRAGVHTIRGEQGTAAHLE